VAAALVSVAAGSPEALGFGPRNCGKAAKKAWCANSNDGEALMASYQTRSFGNGVRSNLMISSCANITPKCTSASVRYDPIAINGLFVK